MPVGEIKKWFEGGYGFIADDQQPHAKWVFIHISEIGREPEVGEVFSYAVVPTGDGRTKAVDVEPIATAAREECDRVFGD